MQGGKNRNNQPSKIYFLEKKKKKKREGEGESLAPCPCASDSNAMKDWMATAVAEWMRWEVGTGTYERPQVCSITVKTPRPFLL